MVVVQRPDVEPVMSRLRDQTRPQHEAAEAVLAHLMDSPSLRGYRIVLERWYGFYAVLEPRLDAWHRRTGLLDREPRRRLPLLAADLDALGCGQAALPGLPRCPDVPPIRTTADGLGALYVVEGSTLGGRLLRARLLEAGLPPGVCHFLGSGGRDVGRLWRECRAVTTAWVEQHPADADDVVASARATFDAVVDWHARAAVTT